MSLVVSNFQIRPTASFVIKILIIGLLYNFFTMSCKLKELYVMRDVIDAIFEHGVIVVHTKVKMPKTVRPPFPHGVGHAPFSKIFLGVGRVLTVPGNRLAKF